MLSPENKRKLDDIVVKMSAQNATPREVQVIVSDFMSKYGGRSSSPYETENAFTSPVVKYEDTKSPVGAIGAAVANAPTSALRTAGNLANAALNVANPDLEKNTLVNLARTGAGAVQSIPGLDSLFNLVSRGGDKNQILKGNRDRFSGFVQSLKDRYGSVENVKRTLTEDPVGVLTDLYFSRTGARAAKRTPVVSKPAKVIEAVTDAPIAPIRAGVDLVKDKASSLRTTVSTARLDEGLKTALAPTSRIPKSELPGAIGRIDPAKLDAQQRRTYQTLETYISQAKKAKVDYSQRTPLEVAGTRAEVALEMLQKRMNKFANLKIKTLEKVGDQAFPEAPKASSFLRSLSKDRLGLQFTDEGVMNAKGRISQVGLDPADTNLLQKVHAELNKLTKESTFREVDDLIDSIQDIVYKRKKNVAIPISSKVEGIIKQVTGYLNKNLKKSVDKAAGVDTYSRSLEKYSFMKSAFDDLNKSLGAKGSKGGSLMKRVFSPTDGGTKHLFKVIKQITGIDLVTEATLAKFAMETTGDFRQRSLLEEAMTGGSLKQTAIQSALEALMNKVMDPESAAKRVIEEGKRLK